MFDKVIWEENEEEPWLKISYSINYQFMTIPNESELDERMDELLQVALQKFKVAQLSNLLNKGISPLLISYKTINEEGLINENTVFGNDEIPRHSFEVKVKKTEDEQDYEFIIIPKETYSLQEYYFDGYTLYKTEEELCKLSKIPINYNSLLEMIYDENNNPVIRHIGTLLRIQYSMKNRIKFAIKNIEMDTNCFGESLFVMMSNMEKDNMKKQFEYNRIWLEKVNILIDEELKRQDKIRKDFEPKLGLMDKIKMLRGRDDKEFI